jgi:hypothetical protein
VRRSLYLGVTARRRLFLVVALLALALAGAASAFAGGGTTTSPAAPVYDKHGRLIQTPFVPPSFGAKQHTRLEALHIFEQDPKVAAWLTRYPVKGRSYDESYAAQQWTIKIWWGKAGEIAEGVVFDPTGAVTEAWTGPQVAWGMARGGNGAFGGTAINDPWVWGAFCLVFLIGLGDWKRPFSLRNLDLLFLLSPTASLWYFNHGQVFAAVPLFYPCLIWVVVRGIFIGATNRGTTGAPRWPVWVLIAGTIFLAGFRVGLNIERSNVIDVGYSGVIGAERIVHGQAPWGNFPQDTVKQNGDPKTCSKTDTEMRIQTDGACERANPLGDTYGPTAYEAYIPAYLITGWSGKWDDLPTAHITAILFDLLTIVGLFLVGLRFGGRRLAAVLAFAWVAYPFTQYVSNSNTNDAIMPCFLVWAFWPITRPAARGVLSAAAGWTKFASLITFPLWLTYPTGRVNWRYLAGFVAGTLAVFSILLLEPHPLHLTPLRVWHFSVPVPHEVATFWHRTIGYQFGRDAPWSLWDWRQYHARGLPDLHVLQRFFQVLLLVGALVVAFKPRRKSPLQLAAFTAVLIAGFEMVQTYWLYTYIPWFYPFAAITLLVPATGLRRLFDRGAGVEADRFDAPSVPAGVDGDYDSPEPDTSFDWPEPAEGVAPEVDASP